MESGERERRKRAEKESGERRKRAESGERERRAEARRRTKCEERRAGAMPHFFSVFLMILGHG
jgi:hypothetical protein